MPELNDIVELPEVFFDTTGQPLLPALTLLYGIEPRGVGTGACESLKSYIGRLADVHRISPVALIKEVLYEKLLAYNLPWKSSRIRSKGNPLFYFGRGEVTRGWTSVLTDTTGITGLEYCSMLPIQGILSTKCLIASRERHCPLCLQDADEASGLYGRLIWEVACVTACPIHGIRLVPSKCGAPEDKHLNLSRRKILAGLCSTCGSIGYRCREEIPAAASEVEIWKAQQVAELIACFPLASMIFSKKALVAGITSLVETFADGKLAVAARRAGIPKSVLWGWMKELSIPSLDLLLSLCLAAGVSLVSVMEGSPARCISPAPDIKPRGNAKNKPTKDVREKALKEALLKGSPQSLKSIAAFLNIDRKMLSRHFPELSAMVVEHYQRFRMAERDERRERTRKQARYLIDGLADAGLPPTVSNLQKAAGEPLMPNDLLRKVLHEMLAEQKRSESSLRKTGSDKLR